MWEFFSKSKEKFKAKIWGFIKSGLDSLGLTVLEDKEKGFGFKTKYGKTFIPEATHDVIDHPVKVIDWFKSITSELKIDW